MDSETQKTVVNFNICLILSNLNCQLKFIALKVWQFA